MGLSGVGPAAAPKRRGGIGPHHLARQVDTIDELEQARLILVNAGAYSGESSGGDQADWSASSERRSRMPARLAPRRVTPATSITPLAPSEPPVTS